MKKRNNFLSLLTFLFIICILLVGSIIFLFIYAKNNSSASSDSSDIINRTSENTIATTNTSKGDTDVSKPTESEEAVSPTADSTNADISAENQGITDASKPESSAPAAESDRQLKKFPEQDLPILSPPRASVEVLQKFARNRNAAQIFIDLAPVFWQIAVDKGVDPLVVYCQSALETNFMHFTGVLTADFHNPCGLKTAKGGGDYVVSAHKQFPDWETGITAQVDHLALYAGADGYPLAETEDPRHFKYLFNQAPLINDLGGRWAPAKDYGEVIRRLMEEANFFN